MTRRTINVDGAVYCADVSGALPGAMAINNATAGACVAAPPPGQVPAGRQVIADIGYDMHGSDIARGVDVTQAANIWGSPPGTHRPVIGFPWSNCARVFRNLRLDMYVAAEFTVPEDTHATIGMYTHGGTLSGPRMIMSLSAHPGDFNADTALIVSGPKGPSERFFGWKTDLVTTPDYGVLLQRGHTYFANLRAAERATGVAIVNINSNHN